MGSERVLLVAFERGLSEMMSLVSKDILGRSIFCVVLNHLSCCNGCWLGTAQSASSCWGFGRSRLIVQTLCVDVTVGKVLPTEGTHELVLLKLSSISVNQSGPLIHLVASLLIKFILEEVIFLFNLLGKFPNNIVFESEQFPLFFIVLHQYPFLCQLSGQVIRKNINFNLELLCDCIINVVVNLSVLMQESK